MLIVNLIFAFLAMVSAAQQGLNRGFALISVAALVGANVMAYTLAGVN
jgi:hypothetical protein